MCSTVNVGFMCTLIPTPHPSAMYPHLFSKALKPLPLNPPSSPHTFNFVDQFSHCVAFASLLLPYSLVFNPCFMIGISIQKTKHKLTKAAHFRQERYLILVLQKWYIFGYFSILKTFRQILGCFLISFTICDFTFCFYSLFNGRDDHHCLFRDSVLERLVQPKDLTLLFQQNIRKTASFV